MKECVLLTSASYKLQLTARYIAKIVRISSVITQKGFHSANLFSYSTPLFLPNIYKETRKLWNFILFHQFLLTSIRKAARIDSTVQHRHTSRFSFMTNAPTPSRCVAFSGRVCLYLGIQYTSIKYLGSAWWYQNPSCKEYKSGWTNIRTLLMGQLKINVQKNAYIIMYPKNLVKHKSSPLQQVQQGSLVQ